MPCRVGGDGSSFGEEIPVEGTAFPDRFASFVEPQRTAIADARARIERRDGTTQDLGSETEAARGRDDVHVHAHPGTQRSRTFNQRATGTEVDERHRIAWTQDRLRAGNGRLAEALIEPTID